jgi:hypothetical protein
MRSIGTEGEFSLHRDLKFTYAGSRGRTEAPVAGFVADGINAKGEVIEIQTGSFGPLKKKVEILAAQGKVRIIHPVIITKYIEVFDTKGKRLYRRKSPRRGKAWDLFDALVYAPELPLIPRVTVELALVDADEIRCKDGKGSWRRRGISIRDRVMTAFHQRIRLAKPADYLRFVPFKKNEKFTCALLGEKAGIDVNLARKTLYVLTRIGVVEKTGKQGNAFVYRIIRAGAY